MTKIGFCITGSFCCLDKMLLALNDLATKGYDIYPIMTKECYNFDTRFFKAKDLIKQVESITNKKIITTIQESEYFGPSKLLDIIVVYPCTSNTLAKLANGINDDAVTMACKSTYRNNKNIVIGLCSNDALSTSGVNLMTLLNRKQYYTMPMYQDDCKNKPCSLLADNDKVVDTVQQALNNQQVQPIFVTKTK